MPRSFLPLVPVLVGCLAAATATAQMVICPGNPVQLELDQSYYGVKTWEFSPDSISWNSVDIVEQEPFVLQPEQAGFYRVSFHDPDCDTTYVSNTIQFRFPAPVHLQSLYEDHQIAESVNPVFWLDRYSELTDIVYVLNGVEYPSTLQFEMLPNPGSAFEIYTNALDASGCAVHSDTLHFTVFNSDMAGIGTLQTTAAITGNDIVVTSSIDTVALVSGQPFDILYSLDYDSDMIVAQRLANGTPGPVIAMHLAISEGATFNLSEASTAIAIILSHPDVAYLAPQHYDMIAAWLADQSDFQTLRDQFTADLVALGHLDLQAPSIPSLRSQLITGMLSELLPQLMGGAFHAQSPWLAVDNAEPTSLIYDHDGINLGYVARTFYNGSPVSSPVLFAGDSHPDISSINPNIKGLICYILQMNVRFDLISADQTLRMSSISLNEDFAELDVWLVNGEGPQHANERDIAERYNTFIFAHRVITGCLPGTILGELLNEDNCVRLRTINLIGTLFSASQQPTGPEITDQIQSWSIDVLECVAPDDVLEWVSPLLNLDALNEVGFMVQMIYDLHGQESELIYRNTKFGSQWVGKLVIESNVAEQFVGIPGSMTTVIPTITVKSREAHVRRPSGSELYLALPTDIDLFDAGVTFNALMVNTETIGVPSGSTYTQQFLNEPVQSGLNQFNWRLETDANPPQTAQFNVGIYHPTGELPNYVEGYEAGGLAFTAAIEQPVLEVIGNDPLTGLSNESLEVVARVKTQSGQAINDYPVHFVVMEGGGSIDFLGQSEATILSAPYLVDGIVHPHWILGELGDQVLHAFIDQGPGVLAEVDFHADLTTISLDGYAYSVVSWRFFPIPGEVNFQVCDVPPVMEFVAGKTVTFDASSYMMEIWNEDGTSSVGGPYPYSIGSYSADSLFMFSDGASGIGLDCTNSYGHQYPEGWGVKIPPGFTLNWGSETFDVLPTRVSLDGLQITRAQTGDEVYMRQ